MIRIERVSPESDRGWDRAESGGGYQELTQSHLWARIIAEVDRAEPVFAQLKRSGRPGSGCLFLKKHIASRAGMGASSAVHWLSSKTGSFLECLGGPFPITEDGPVEFRDLEHWGEWAIDQARALGCWGIRWQERAEPENPEGRSALGEALGGLGFGRTEWATSLIDLSKSSEELWKGLKKAARKAVNKGARAGLRVVEAEGLEEVRRSFYEPYVGSELGQGRRVNPFSVFETMIREDNRGAYRWFTAEDEEGRVLATLGLALFGGRATEIASTLTPAAKESGLPAQDVLHWELILKAKESGQRFFDLAGFNPAPESPKEVGIRRFKEKWGGRTVTYGVHRLSWGVRGKVLGRRFL